MVLDKRRPVMASTRSPPCTPAEPASLDLPSLGSSPSDGTEVRKATALFNFELRKSDRDQSRQAAPNTVRWRLTPFLQGHLLVSGTKDTSFGAAIGWVAGDGNRKKTTSLGIYLTVTDSELFAICMAVRKSQFLLPKTAKRCVEIVSDSHGALSTIDKASGWTTPMVRDTSGPTPNFGES